MRPVEPQWSTFTTPGSDAPAWWDPASEESVDPWTDSVCVGGTELAQGSAVRLHPSGQADAQDMFLKGRRGTVAGVFSDVDGGIHLAVTIDDDEAAPRVDVAGSLPLLPARRGRAAARPERRGPPVTRRILVAGIGNVFLSDDAFGVEVAHLLAGRVLPDGVRVEDYGIRGIHLAYDLLDGYDALLLVDAVPMGEPPGTLVVLEPEPAVGRGTRSSSNAGGDGVVAVDAHTMSPDVVLATLARLGGSVDRIVIVGCQPGELDEGMGLSPPVQAAITSAVDLCLEIVADIAQPAERGVHR